MRLFGKRNKEKEKGEVLLGEPLKLRLPEDPVPHVAEDPALPAEIAGGGLEPAIQPEGQGMEALLRENEALKREIAELKSRIAYARSVLLADVEVPESSHVSLQMRQQEPATMARDAMATAAATTTGAMAPQAQVGGMVASQPGMGMDGQMASSAPSLQPQSQPADDIRAMLAELKQDIASIQREVSQPSVAGMVATGATGVAGTTAVAAAQPADDIRAMLAELKQDIASIQREVSQPSVAGMTATGAAGVAGTAAVAAAQPADDIRAMLAELKQDIASIRRETPSPATSVPQPPAEDLRAMLAELKQDIAAIRRDEPMVQRHQDGDLREMLAKLKADIDSLKKEKEEPARKADEEPPAVPENGVHRLLEELQQGVAELSLGSQEVAAAAEGRATPSAAANPDPLLDLPEREGRAPLFGGGQVRPKPEAGKGEEKKSEASGAETTASGEDELSSRIESLLAELHNELRQASGREFLKEEGSATSDAAALDHELDDEEPRRAALR